MITYVNPRRFMIGMYRKPRARAFVERKDYRRNVRLWLSVLGEYRG
jgi:hypothetical protein